MFRRIALALIASAVLSGCDTPPTPKGYDTKQEYCDSLRAFIHDRAFLRMGADTLHAYEQAHSLGCIEWTGEGNWWPGDDDA